MGIRLDKNDSAVEVQRFDLARLSSRVKMTPQGFLKAPAFFTKAGVFEYRRADGTTVRELRPEEEVFRADSLASAAGAPITRDHPKEGMVNAENAKTLAVGFLSENVERQDTRLAGQVMVFDAATIKDVQDRKLCEFSMGYTCSIERTAGVHPKFGRYDQIQRNIRYNHAALGGPGWGRAGADIGVRLDSEGAVERVDGGFTGYLRQQMDLAQMDLEALAKAAGFELLALEDVVWGFRPPTKQELSKIAAALKIEVETLTRLAPRVDRADKRDNMDEEVIVIGGVEFKVPKAAAQAMRAENARKDSQIQELTSQRDGLQGRFDAQAQELGQLKTKVSEFDSRLDNAVVERETFLSKARKVLGADGDVTGTKRQVMERAIKHDSKDLDLTGRSDDYVESRFDALVETFDQADRADKSKDSTRRAALEATRQDGGGKRPSAEEARRKMVEANQNAWKPAGQNA